MHPHEENLLYFQTKKGEQFFFSSIVGSCTFYLGHAGSQYTPNSEEVSRFANLLRGVNSSVTVLATPVNFAPAQGSLELFNRKGRAIGWIVESLYAKRTDPTPVIPVKIPAEAVPEPKLVQDDIETDPGPLAPKRKRTVPKKRGK